MSLNCTAATGPIGLGQVRTILGESGAISLDDDDVRIFSEKTQRGSKISFDNLRNKCPVYTVEVGAPVRAWEGDNHLNLDSYIYDINLGTLANNSSKMPSSGPPPGSKWIFKLLCNIGSKDREGYAIDTGTWPHSNIELVIQNPALTDQFGQTISVDTDDSLKIASWVWENTKGPCNTSSSSFGGNPCIPGVSTPVNRNNPLAGYFLSVGLKTTNPYRNLPVEGSRFCVLRSNRNEPCNGGANCVPDWVTFPSYANSSDYQNCRMTGQRWDSRNPRAFKGFFQVQRARRVPANPKTFGRFENMNFLPVQGLIAGRGGEGINNNNANPLAGGQVYRPNGTTASDFGSNRSGGSAILMRHPLS